MDLLYILTFLLLLLATDAQECNTPLIRDVISIDPAKSRAMKLDIGDLSSFITGLPLLDSSHPLTIRTSGSAFTYPHFMLAAKDAFSPHFWITALEIQQGPAGTVCSSTGIIKELVIEVKEATGYSAVSTPFKAGTLARNSAPYYDWQRMGGTKGDGQITRFSFGPIAGDGIRFEVLNIDPLSSSVSTEVCLRVEVYGCEKTDNTPPAVNTGPLYQYNMAQPTAELYGNRYTDPGYTGITSSGYLSGGTGLLSDGTVGGDAEGAPAQWIGWNKTETPQIEVLLLLKSSHQFDRINLFYWADSAGGTGPPDDVSILDQTDATIPFTFEDINFGDKVKARSFIRDTQVLSSYVKLRMGYAAGAGALLLTEIELVKQDATNVLTGSAASISTSPTPTPATTTAPTTAPPTTSATTTATTATTSPTTETTASTSAATSSSADTNTDTQPHSSTQTREVGTAETTSSPALSTGSTAAPSPQTDTETEDTGDPSSVSPTGSAALREDLIIGLIFVIIIIIIIVLIAILVVSLFYYMRSKGKRVQDISCMGGAGAGGPQFKKLWNGDAESGGGRAGSLKNKLKSVRLLKGRREPVYEPVKGLEISGPIPEKPEGKQTEEYNSTEGADSFTDKFDDLHIYAPLSEVMPVYASVHKERSRVYSEPHLDLSLPSTPLDADQSQQQHLQPLGSIYEAPDLLTAAEGPRVLAWKDIEEHELLGNGLFGEVCLALLVNYSAKELGIGASEKLGVEIAIKKLSGESTQQTKDNFSNEVKFMARLDHPNVIRLIGVCLDATPGRFLAMEYMINGDLAQFLKESDFVDSIGANLRIQEVNQDCMVYMGQQIASGMEYLSDRNYIHRDLSARNCLVGTNYTVKVADFGMSQNLYSSEYFKITGRATLPIRWMPNESFYGKFTLKSDVWAFGVTLWEVFCKCQDKPYSGLSDHELIQDVLANKEGRARLERPPYAPEEGWELIQRCTELNQDQRPGFGAIRRELEDMCKFQIEEINI